MLHFLHIGKTGGSALKYVLKDIQETRYGPLKLHVHRTCLIDIPEGEKVFFYLRNPYTRFLSGFYSRKRQGRPRYNSKWTEDEAKAFANFKCPLHLLESACGESDAEKATAMHALDSIQHVKDKYSKWLGTLEYLEHRMSDIVFIGFQENFESDFEVLKNKLGLPSGMVLPESEEGRHANPSYSVPKLSQKLEAFFKQQFESDYAIHQFCCTHFRER